MYMVCVCVTVCVPVTRVCAVCLFLSLFQADNAVPLFPVVWRRRRSRQVAPRQPVKGEEEVTEPGPLEGTSSIWSPDLSTGSPPSNGSPRRFVPVCEKIL